MRSLNAKRVQVFKLSVWNGAAGKNRTFDLALTKGALYP